MGRAKKKRKNRMKINRNKRFWNKDIKLFTEAFKRFKELVKKSAFSLQDFSDMCKRLSGIKK